MLTLKRLAIYLFIFFAVAILLIVFINFRTFDNYVVNEINKTGFSSFELNKEIVLIDLQKKKTGSEGTDVRQFRQSLVSLLNTIAVETKNKKGPKGVLLDLWFSSDTTEIEPLKTALKGLKDLNVPVYAAYNVNEKHERLDVNKIDIDAIEDVHETSIYSEFLAGSDDTTPGKGRYHTLFYPEGDVANYENDLYFYSGIGRDTVLIESLARKVALDLTASTGMRHQPKRIGSIVPYRPQAAMAEATYTFVPGNNGSPGSFKKGAAAQAAVDMDKNILVVGDILNDRVDISANRQVPGPYIITWALNDLLDNNTSVKLPIESLALITGQILFFSFLAVLIYSLLFKYVKRLQTKPAAIAILSFCVCMIFFFLYFKVILSFNHIIPVSHTVVATAVACILSYRFAHKFLVTGVAEGSQKYDVFISYSRSQSDWVDKHVYQPLAAYTKPNGEKLNIFYDKKSIGLGEMFTTKYMWAIVDTKFFIPVFSDDYYAKNHCRNEMDCAVKRDVEKLLHIQGVALSFNAVPEAFHCINFVDVTQNPAFIDVIESEYSKQFAVSQTGALTIKAKDAIISKPPIIPVNKEANNALKNESNGIEAIVVKEEKIVSTINTESLAPTIFTLVEKDVGRLSKDGFLLKHYCLEKAIEVYHCNQSVPVVELAEAFEHYLKSKSSPA